MLLMEEMLVMLLSGVRVTVRSCLKSRRLCVVLILKGTIQVVRTV